MLSSPIADEGDSGFNMPSSQPVASRRNETGNCQHLARLSIELSPPTQHLPAVVQRPAVMTSRQPTDEVARLRPPSPTDYDRQSGVPPPRENHYNCQVPKEVSTFDYVNTSIIIDICISASEKGYTEHNWKVGVPPNIVIENVCRTCFRICCHISHSYVDNVIKEIRNEFASTVDAPSSDKTAIDSGKAAMVMKLAAKQVL